MEDMEDMEKYIQNLTGTLKEKLMARLPELKGLLAKVEQAVASASTPEERVNSRDIWQAVRELQVFFHEFGYATAVTVAAEGEWKLILCNLSRPRESAPLDASLLTDPEFTKFLKDNNLTPFKE